MQLEHDWNPMARLMGYADEREMLRHMYCDLHFTTREIARVVESTHYTVRRHLALAGVQMRSRGGPLRLGKRKLANVDSTMLFNTSAYELATMFSIHPTAVWYERRLRAREWKQSTSDNSSASTP